MKEKKFATLEIKYTDHTYTATVFNVESMLFYLAQVNRPFVLGEFVPATGDKARMKPLEALVKFINNQGIIRVSNNPSDA